MRFLTDENVAASVVNGLRRAEHDVLAAKEAMRGRSDQEILGRAVSEAQNPPRQAVGLPAARRFISHERPGNEQVRCVRLEVSHAR